MMMVEDYDDDNFDDYDDDDDAKKSMLPAPIVSQILWCLSMEPEVNNEYWIHIYNFYIQYLFYILSLLRISFDAWG